MNSSDSCNESFLIIAGAIKSGTTSLHGYLSDHPCICASVPKDPGYFLPLDFPMQSSIRHERDALSEYLAIFPDYKPGQLRLESSPNYLPVKGVAETIKKVLPNTRIVITLRDPISRLISYFQMSVLFGWLPKDLTFDEYINEVKIIGSKENANPNYIFPIRDSLYSENIQHWQSIFGKENVLILWFDDIRSSPHSVISKIVEFAGLDPDFYKDYHFENVNPARTPKYGPVLNAHMNIRKFAKTVLRRYPRAKKLFSDINKKLVLLFLFKLLTTKTSPIKPSPDTLSYLKKFYAQDVQKLQGIVGEEPPWADQYHRLVRD